MTEERWTQVKALFQATVERAPSERAAFLTAAVNGDDALRRDVESLLESDSSGAGFTDRLPDLSLSSAPDFMSADLKSGEATRTATGLARASIGPYRVIAPLGAGGMGEVFRARDSKLNRDVALKVLPSAFELDPDRLARFGREAQALAALNHPHIGAIYGLEESNGRQALVLELVEGVTLANRIDRGPLPLADALTVARQIIAALQAAHDKGIIHRDLKPANIKITPANVVKVLDFGLAKTVVGDPLTRASHLPTQADQTQIGAVLGTAAYMSPEQARGIEVDARTDVWAFGCVLFEMLTGVKAFAPDATSDSITKILEREPDWAALPKTVPVKIAELIRQCLQKDRSKRLSTIGEASAIVEQVLTPRASAARMWATLGAAGIVGMSAGAYMWLRVDTRPLASRADWVQLTNLDSVTQPALSPDGRMLAFIRGPSTFVSPGQLYVKLLPDGEPVALTNDNLPKMSPVFSPDGNRIAYTVSEGSSWDTWEVPTLRGQARRWLRNASGLTWVGPSELMFSEVKNERNLMAIVRSSESGPGTRDLYVPPSQSGMAHRSYVSPDRKHVLVVEMDDRGVWLPCRLLLSDGGESRAVGPSMARCTNAAWSPDGRWMYFSADAGDGFHIWRQRFPSGAPQQLTFGPTEEEGLALAGDGNSIVTSSGLTQRSVWLRDHSGERQISLEGYAFYPLLSTDGRKVCFRVTPSVATGQSPSELWMVELETGQHRRLFPGQLVTSYDLSRDDRVIAAIQEQSGQSGIWLGWLDGREPPHRIPQVNGDSPRFGRDGEIVFRVREGATAWLYRSQENGERREKIGQAFGAVFGTVSPDGEWLSGIGNENRKMVVYSTRGQPSRAIFPNSQASRLRWSWDGRSAYLSIQYAQASAFAAGRTYVLPLTKGTVFPPIPTGGFGTEAELASLPGVEIIAHGDLALGPTPSVYAYSRITTTRNLYRIPLH
jgi:Tol biopolymer transport system component